MKKDRIKYAVFSVRKGGIFIKRGRVVDCNGKSVTSKAMTMPFYPDRSSAERYKRQLKAFNANVDYAVIEVIPSART